MKFKVDAFIAVFKNMNPKTLAFSGTRLTAKGIRSVFECRNSNWQKKNRTHFPSVH